MGTQYVYNINAYNRVHNTYTIQINSHEHKPKGYLPVNSQMQLNIMSHALHFAKYLLDDVTPVTGMMLKYINT